MMLIIMELMKLQMKENSQKGATHWKIIFNKYRWNEWNSSVALKPIQCEVNAWWALKISFWYGLCGVDAGVHVWLHLWTEWMAFCGQANNRDGVVWIHSKGFYQTDSCMEPFSWEDFTSFTWIYRMPPFKRAIQKSFCDIRQLITKER